MSDQARAKSRFYKTILRKLKTFTAKGLLHFKQPPDIEGKHDYGIKPSLTFFFETEEQKQFIYNMFKDGRSRIPSGKRLLEFTKRFTEAPNQKRLEDAKP